MDERESSVTSSVDFYESSKSTTPPREAQNGAGTAKRKADDIASRSEKKRKLDSQTSSACSLRPCAGLPPAIWQHVFLSCSLFDLGRLLQVNRSFRSYLIDVRNVSLPDTESGTLRLLKSDSIWASARNALPVKPPKPLLGFSERQMCELAWARRCQFCGKENAFVPGEKIWQQGPDGNGVRTVWPLGIKTCGLCLMERCQTDSSLLFSAASALRPALPFVFITHDRNYIPAYTLQAATTPASVEIAKYYYKPHVNELQKELQDALSLGHSAAEEWSKGLEARGMERMKSAENWERWEVKYKWWADHREPQRAPSAALSAKFSPAPTSHKEASKSPAHQAPSPIIHAPVPATIAPSYYNHQRPQTVPQAYTPGLVPSGSVAPGRSERNLHDANEAKANRKADIERRCQQMDPPIPPKILRHMDSFKAAIQISQPMNDYSWSVLQPRLLAQLPAAQQAEADHVSRAATLPKTTDRRLLDVNSKEYKEVMDREWEESQRPIRDRLSAIADDFINQDWDHGNAVTYENSPKFAADILMYIRRMYYSQDGAFAHNQNGANPEAEDASSRPKLVLESMKWVYDNKVKPLTEQYRKELFLCYGQECEGTARFYGFEGVIQHFGAKHTNAFSVGNVVVHWREAEWPEETPFHPDPISAQHAFHSSGYGGYYSGYTRAGTSTPHMQPHLPPQVSPAPYHLGGQYNGPFAPPQIPTVGTPGFGFGQAYGPPPEAYGSHQYQPNTSPAYGYQPGNGYMTSPAMSHPAPALTPGGPATIPSAGESSPGKPEDADYRTNLFDKQVSTVIDLSQNLWKQTSGIKDIPNSLRIYVLVQRAISKFHVEFNHEPNLNHFIDAFSNHEIPKALKNAPGLSCKACQEEHSKHTSVPQERRTYTALNLFSHFKSQHSGTSLQGYGNGQISPTLDWREEMIELPNDRFISGLIHAPGMDDEKLLMIATVFPKLFPMPLPKIGGPDKDVASDGVEASKELPDALLPQSTPGPVVEDSRPSPLASPYMGSPRQSKPAEDEYDPQRPALPPQGYQPTRLVPRRQSYRNSPPNDRRTRYYSEQRYYLPREPLDDGYARPREYLDYAPSPRRFREPGPVYEEYHDRRPVYRDHGAYYHPGHDDVGYAQPREGVHVQDYGPYPRQLRYVDDDAARPEYRPIREPRSREPSDPRGRSIADRLAEDIMTLRPATGDQGDPIEPTVPAAEADQDDEPRYTPPPPTGIPPADIDPTRSLGPVPPTAGSTISNGSRYDEYRGGGRQIPTPDSGRGRRTGPHRRRDRYHDHAPSRYYRYMSVARDEPYSRGASVSRQNKRYERYEEQRRRIDQQETPQPHANRDDYPIRDHSVDHGPPDDVAPYPIRRSAPREYISVQDRLRPYSPPRYRYANYPEDTRGPAPVYVEDYHEYEIIRVPRDPRQARGQYVQHPPARYVEEPMHEPYGYVYDRPVAGQRFEGGRPEYVYYDDRDRERLPPPAQVQARRPAPVEQQSEAEYEPLGVEIKVESQAGDGA